MSQRNGSTAGLFDQNSTNGSFAIKLRRAYAQDMSAVVPSQTQSVPIGTFAGVLDERFKGC